MAAPTKLQPRLSANQRVNLIRAYTPALSTSKELGLTRNLQATDFKTMFITVCRGRTPGRPADFASREPTGRPRAASPTKIVHVTVVGLAWKFTA